MKVWFLLLVTSCIMSLLWKEMSSESSATRLWLTFVWQICGIQIQSAGVLIKKQTKQEYIQMYCISSDSTIRLKFLVFCSSDTLKGFLDTTDKGFCQWHSRVSWTFPCKVDILWRTRRYCKNEWPSEGPKYQAGPCLSNKTMTGAN